MGNRTDRPVRGAFTYDFVIGVNEAAIIRYSLCATYFYKIVAIIFGAPIKNKTAD